MHHMSPLEHGLWLSSIVGYALVLFRLSWSGLLRTYRCFAFYLGVELSRSLLLLSVFVLDRKDYGWAFLLTAPVVWLAFILVVLELYSLVLKKYEGISTLSQWAMRVVLTIAVLVAILTLLPEMPPDAKRFEWLTVASLIERGVVSSLVVFLLIITAFLVWYPVPLSRNTILHTTLYSLYFLVTAVGLFWRDMTSYEMTRQMSTTLMALTNVCLLLWLVFLRRSGEVVKSRIGARLSAESEARLLQQLDSLNSSLLRSSRR